jgi:hypothetical protein
MTKGAHGFMIQCAGCAKEFDSKRLRCCSAECERPYREREQNLAVLAEVGIEAKVKRTCANPECGATIPTWRNGRRESAKVLYCSPKCARKAQRLAA